MFEDVTIEQICAAAADGDPLAVEVIEQLGRYLGAAIAIVINLFNPEKVLIGGVINQAKERVVSCDSKVYRRAELVGLPSRLRVSGVSIL